MYQTLIHLFRRNKITNFSEALERLKEGARVQRTEWNGKGMHIELQEVTPLSKMTLPYIYMKTADDKNVPWSASQTDIFANDWQIVEGE